MGQDKGHKIKELGCSTELEGKLRIVNLEHVRDKEEARGAKLSEKAKIKTLVLVWSAIRESSCNSIINYKDVLEGLQPHPNIRSLEIENYHDDFPPWLLMPKLNNLVVLKLKGCDKCEKIPELGYFSFLEILELEGLHSVSWIGSEDKTLFPALQRVSLKDMESLLEWKVTETAAGGTKVAFPCLEELYIEKCTKLESIPSMSHFPRLEILELKGLYRVSCISSEDRTMPASLFPVLKRVSLKDMESLLKWKVHETATGGTKVVFPCLEELYIEKCAKLKSIPSMCHFPRLETLELKGLYRVSCVGSDDRTMPASLFPALKRVSLKDMDMESLLEWTVPEAAAGGMEVAFPCLEELYIEKCANLESIPFMSHFPHLEILKLEGLDIKWIGCENMPPSLFPALKKVSLKDMESLLKWKLPKTAAGGTKVAFPCIEELYIEECWNLRSIPSMSHFPRLEILELKGLYRVSYIGSKDRTMPASLFPALKRLSLKEMDSLLEWKVPKRAAGGTKVAFPCLEELYIEDCESLKSIPSMSHFPRLEILEFKGLYTVSCIGSEDRTMHASLFPSLKKATLKDMKSLLEWTVPEAAAGGMEVAFPCLEELYIEGCPKLESIPSMSHFSSKLARLTINRCGALSHVSGEFDASAKSLEYLYINCCPKLESIPSLQNCTALEVLCIIACNNVVSIILELPSLRRVRISGCVEASVRISSPLSCATIEELKVDNCRELILFYDHDDSRGGELMPSRLQSLVVTDCEYFKSVPNGLNRRLHSLVRLIIIHCKNLSHIPEDFFCGLNQLKELRIGDFSEELEAFPGMNSIQHLGGSLKKLEIGGWRKLKSLPHQLQHLTSLAELEICAFVGEEFEEALPDWLANFSSLQELTIRGCIHLKYLPSSTAMQILSKLKRLHISFCPFLVQNCERDSGSEWLKISHIPYIDIDWDCTSFLWT